MASSRSVSTNWFEHLDDNDKDDMRALVKYATLLDDQAVMFRDVDQDNSKETARQVRWKALLDTFTDVDHPERFEADLSLSEREFVALENAARYVGQSKYGFRIPNDAFKTTFGDLHDKTNVRKVLLDIVTLLCVPLRQSEIVFVALHKNCWFNAIPVRYTTDELEAAISACKSSTDADMQINPFWSLNALVDHICRGFSARGNPFELFLLMCFACGARGKGTVPR